MSEEILARLEALEMGQNTIREKLDKLEKTPVKEKTSFLSKFSLPSMPFRKRESAEEARNREKDRRSTAILAREPKIISRADEFNRMRQVQFDKANNAARKEVLRQPPITPIRDEVVEEGSFGGRKRTKRKRTNRKSRRS